MTTLIEPEDSSVVRKTCDGCGRLLRNTTEYVMPSENHEMVTYNYCKNCADNRNLD